MLNAHRLRLLAELRRLGTLAEVAASLSYSPSAVSQQLALLEREVGRPLFEKEGRRLRLTDAGLLLADRADAVVELLERTESDLAAQRDVVSGTLRVASFDSVLLSLAPRTLQLLAERHPKLEVYLTQSDIEAAWPRLLSQDFDIVVGEEYPGQPGQRHAGVHRDQVIADRVVLTLPTTGPWSHPETIADLVDAPWAIDPDTTSVGAWGRASLRELGIEPRVQFELSNPLLMVALARAGQAVSLVPVLVGPEMLAGTRQLTLPGDPRRRLYTAVRTGRRHHPAVRAFREAFHDAARTTDLDLPVAPIPT